MDQMEARAVVNRYLKDHSVLDLYDSVMIPAMNLAEQDRHQGALDPPEGSSCSSILRRLWRSVRREFGGPLMNRHL